MTRTLLLLAVALVACSDDRSLAPSAPACTGVGCANNTGVVGGGGGKGDATVSDTLSDTPLDIGDAGATFNVTVRSTARFTDDPALGTPLTMNVLVRANKFGGGTTEGILSLDGSHAMRDVAVNPGVPTTLSVLTSGITRAVNGVWLPTSVALNIPLFNETLPQTLWPSVVPTAVYPTNSAHVVVHVYNSAGARRAGVTSLTTGDARGPFYDDGSDIAPGRTSTGAKGTIVFLGSVASTLTVSLNSGVTSVSYTVPLVANAVTHFTARID